MKIPPPLILLSNLTFDLKKKMNKTLYHSPIHPTCDISFIDLQGSVFLVPLSLVPLSMNLLTPDTQ